MVELLDRARQLVAAGPYDARPAEIAAVHDAIWPEKAPVCPTLQCRRVLGIAYFSIKRWAERQAAAGDAPLSSPFMKKSAARFKSDSTIYTPHGLGVSYSNANLTDNAARAILKADPDAERLFDVLPAEQADEPTDNSDEEDTSTDESDAMTATGLSEADLDKLADKVADRLRAGLKAAPAEPQPTQALGIDGQPVAPGVDPVTETVKVEDTAPAVVATEETHTEQTAGGPVDVTTGNVVPEGEADHDGEKPVRLSRMNKEQLQAAYIAEVGGDLPSDAHNDDLREAIAKAREAKA